MDVIEASMIRVYEFIERDARKVKATLVINDLSQ